MLYAYASTKVRNVVNILMADLGLLLAVADWGGEGGQVGRVEHVERRDDGDPGGEGSRCSRLAGSVSGQKNDHSLVL